MGKREILISCHFFFFFPSPKEIFFLRPDVCKLKFEGKTFYVIGTCEGGQKLLFYLSVVGCACVCLYMRVCRCACAEKVSGMTCTCSNVAPKDHDVKVCGDTEI